MVLARCGRHNACRILHQQEEGGCTVHPQSSGGWSFLMITGFFALNFEPHATYTGSSILLLDSNTFHARKVMLQTCELSRVDGDATVLSSRS